MLATITLGITTSKASWGQPSLGTSARASAYQDDDATRVLTGVVAVDATALDHAKLGAHYLVDVVSSASVDVVSAATSTFDETRREYEVHAGYFDASGGVSVAYRHSGENDWDSDTGTLAASRDFFVHNLTLGVAFAFTQNRVGRADDSNFREELYGYSANVSAVVVLGREDIGAVSYAASLLDGYQASPYRFVRFFDPVAQATLTQPEAVPNDRLRHALVLQHNRHLFEDSALRSHARLYLDDWGLASGTLGTEYVHGLAHFEPSVFVRGYAQTKASFYEDVYPSQREYMTADRELSGFFDVFLGAALRYHRENLGFLDEFSADARVTGFRFEFLDFARLPERQGVLLELGLGGVL